MSDHLANSLIWHPFTPQWNKEDELCIVRGEGVYLFDSDGNSYIDAISSWWVNLHGHCHPHISSRIAEQAIILEHSIFSGFTHRPALQLAARLKRHLPDSHEKLFFSDDGSTAVEVALKMCLQYWHNKVEQQRSLFVAFENAYHGDTFGGMSVGARNVFNNSFSRLLFDVCHIPLPDESSIEAIAGRLERLIATNRVAGFIFEPLVQGAAGMLMYKASHLDRLMEICACGSVPVIADEVMTGFGRTGKFFASDHLLNKPDIICMSKGLTGGYLPMGLTSCTGKIHEAFVNPDLSKTFFHGHSYTGNPLSCAAALASLDLLEEAGTWQNISRIADRHQRFAEQLSGHRAVKAMRVLGTILAIEVRSDEKTHYLNPVAEKVAPFFLERGIILRPLGNVLYVLPPYVISDEELEKIYTSISEFLSVLS